MWVNRRVAMLFLFVPACASAPTNRSPHPEQQQKAQVACLGSAEARVTYDAACREAEDCRVVTALTDCCGTGRALGVAKGAAAKAERQLAECLLVASCECLAGPTKLDSGEQAEAPENITVTCDEGRCTTRLRAPSPEQSSSERPLPWAERRDGLVAEHERLLPGEDDDAVRAEEQRRAWCLEQVQAPSKHIEGCSLEELGGGSVLLLTLTTECGGDSCSTEAYVQSAELPRFVHVPHNLGSGAEASPAGDALFVSTITDAALPVPDEVKERAPFGPSEPIILSRIALPSMQSEPFARCFSPTLSPAGRWLLCRDRAANVMRLPLSGGELALVVSSGLRPEDVTYVWYAYIWPQPVTFVSATRFRFAIVRESGEVLEQEADWRE